jgi:hypothetical protein
MRQRLATLFAVAVAILSIAAVSTNSIVTPQTPKLAIGQVTNGNTTTAQTLYAAGSNGSKVCNITCTSTDTSNRDIIVSVLRSATTYQLGYLQIPAGAGNGETQSSINLIGVNTPPSAAGGTSPAVNSPSIPLSLDSDGNYCLLLSNGDTLQIGAAATITSAKFLTCFANVADF